MRHDPVAGGNVPALDGSAILDRTPGLEAFAEVEAIDLGFTPASHFTFPTLISIAGTLRERLADPDVSGAVVVQGTDTIEETAFAWDLLLDESKPVVVTGAMRTPDRHDYDGPANLRGAVAAAASAEMRGHGVVVSLAGSLEAADDVVKLHTSALDTFQSPNWGSIGRVGERGVSLVRERGPRRHVRTERAAERVHLVTVTVGMDGSLIDAAVVVGADAIVVAATGAGNTAPAVLEAAKRAMAAGIPVVLASRCLAGRATTDYAVPGGGATWTRAGAILAGTLCAPKVRVAVALGLGAGLDRERLEALVTDPLP